MCGSSGLARLPREESSESLNPCGLSPARLGLRYESSATPKRSRLRRERTATSPCSRLFWEGWPARSVVLLQFGVSGTTGMFFVMAIAGMVCTALSVSGQAITDFKTGYWIGSTPAAQEKIKFLGVIAAAIAASLTIVMLARGFQFAEAAVGDLRPVMALLRLSNW